MADGSIKIDIDVATSKADKQLEDLQQKAKESAEQIGDDFDLDVDNLAKRFEKSRASIEQTSRAVSELERKLSEIDSLKLELSAEEQFISDTMQDRRKLNEMIKEGSISQEEYNRLMKITTDNYDASVVKSETLLSKIKEIGNEEKLNQSLSSKTTTLQNQITSYEMLGNSASKLEDRISNAVEKQSQLGNETKKSTKETERLSKSSNNISSGINKGVKSLVRYAGALFGLRAIYSTLRRLSQQWLNSDAQGTSQVQAQINAMSSAMSNILGPVIQWITSLLSTMFAYLNAILGFFFGINLLSKSTAKNTGGMASGIKDANKEMKKFNAQFDKADVMSSNVSDNMGGAGGGGAVTMPEAVFPEVDITPITNAIEYLKKELQPFFDIMASIDFKPLEDAFMNLRKVGTETFTIIGKSAIRTANTAIAPFIKLLIEDLVPAGLNTFARVLERLNPVIDRLLKDFIEPLIAWILLDFTPTAWYLLLDVFDLLGAVIAVVMESFNTFWDVIGREIAIAGWEILKGVLEVIGDVISTIVDGLDIFLEKLAEGDPLATALATAIGLIVAGLTAYTVIMGLVNAVTAIFAAISPFGWIVIAIVAVIAVIGLLYGYWDDIMSFFSDTLDKLKEFFGNLGVKIKESFQNALQFVKDIWQGVKDWFNDKVIMPVVNYFSNMWQNLKDGAKNAWQGIKDVFSSVANFFGNIFGNAWERVKNIFSTGGQIFSGIKEGIVSAFTSVVNAIIDGINTVVAIPFNAINSALNGLRNISILKMKPFSWLPSISVPRIPRLARGTYADNGSLEALIGESGREAVVPLENNTQWAKDFLGVLDDYGGIGSTGGQSIIQLVVDGKVLYEVNEKQQKKNNLMMNGGMA